VHDPDAADDLGVATDVAASGALVLLVAFGESREVRIGRRRRRLDAV